MFAPSRGGDFLKMGSRSIGGAVVIAAAFKRNTDAVQPRLVSPFLNYSHFLNSPCVDHYCGNLPCNQAVNCKSKCP